MIYLGLDPDTKNTGISIIDDSGSTRVYVASAKGENAKDRVVEMAVALRKTLGPQYYNNGVVAAIEWQAIRPGDVRPNDILNLAIVAGMALSTIVDLYPFATILTPLPVQWKGSIAKLVHQARVLSKLDAGARVVVASMPKMHQSHVTDAIGLAQWARETTESQSRRGLAVLQARALRDQQKLAG